MRISRTNDAHYLDVDADFDDCDRRVLVVEGVAYNGIDEVMRAHPQLGTAECTALYCEAWIRLHHGTGYQVIRDPADFRNRYRMLTQRGRGAVRASQSAGDFGLYDVTEVSEPRLQDDVLRCYVEDRLYGLPYRVELPWPPRPDVVVEFLLLPLQDDEDESFI